MKPIPVIDLFAGSGGLGEGFSSITNQNADPLFKIGLSIEKDPNARKTLVLRAFFGSSAEIGHPKITTITWLARSPELNCGRDIKPKPKRPNRKHGMQSWEGIQRLMN